jgi:hypothetical protein
MHHRSLLFGGTGKAFRRGGIDFAWNVHVVKSGQRARELARAAILPRSTTVGRAGR